MASQAKERESIRRPVTCRATGLSDLYTRPWQRKPFSNTSTATLCPFIGVSQVPAAGRRGIALPLSYPDKIESLAERCSVATSRPSGCSAPLGLGCTPLFGQFYGA